MEAAHSLAEDAYAVVAELDSTNNGDLDTRHMAQNHAHACHTGGTCTVLAILPKAGVTTSTWTSDGTTVAQSMLQGYSEKPTTPPPIT